MRKEDVQDVLDNHKDLRTKLFCRGYVLTDANIAENEYPFYGLWNKSVIETYTLLVSDKQHYYIYAGKKGTWVLVGHAYNPFTMDNDEMTILKKMDEYRGDFLDIFNELTGVFTLHIIKDGRVKIFGDATGMQTTFLGVINDKNWISSHINLIGDLCNLVWSPYIKKLVSYKYFKLLGNSLPGDLTPFDQVKRLTPNFYACLGNGEFKINRFYVPKRQNITNEDIAEKVAAILHGNMELIAQKWKKPAISCTGGCDSKTTMACTIGLYDKFSYFSYISNDSEEVDANAAKVIVNTIGQKHVTYVIPNEDEAYTDLEATRSILMWNTGNMRANNRNDVRKRKFFEDIEDFDVEVKSWASEVGRAYYSKRFANRIDFGKNPSPRKCTTMYKFFLHDRSLVYETDNVFKDWLAKYFQQDKERPIDWQEQLFWEFRVPSWNGMVITGEHKYSFDITIPYNNRKLLELLVSVPIKDRINDSIYTMIRKNMNPGIDKTGIAVTNVKHTQNRARLENLYYWLMTHIPF
jgi:hypothetical protein